MHSKLLEGQIVLCCANTRDRPGVAAHLCLDSLCCATHATSPQGSVTLLSTDTPWAAMAPACLRRDSGGALGVGRTGGGGAGGRRVSAGHKAERAGRVDESAHRCEHGMGSLAHVCMLKLSVKAAPPESTAYSSISGSDITHLSCRVYVHQASPCCTAPAGQSAVQHRTASQSVPQGAVGAVAVTAAGPAQGPARGVPGHCTAQHRAAWNSTMRQGDATTSRYSWKQRDARGQVQCRASGCPYMHTPVCGLRKHPKVVSSSGFPQEDVVIPAGPCSSTQPNTADAKETLTGPDQCSPNLLLLLLLHHLPH
jgi:hypothetical protein